MNSRVTRKLSNDDVGSVLGEDTFQSKPIISSTEEKFITITLDDIEKSSLNPRETKNPKYDDTKESIRNRGLDQPPKITRRTEDQPKWEVAAGGNTRVDILWDLYREYKQLSEETDSIPEKIKYDQKANEFYRFDAVISPWKGEIDGLAAHVVENEQHAPMLFIERARAAKNFKALFEKELRDPEKLSKYADLGVKKLLAEDESLGVRPLARLITAEGWPVDPGNLTRFLYAANELINLIPQALWAGAGHDAVVRIKKLGTAYLGFLSDHLKDEGIAREMFNTLWSETLHANDADKIEWDSVRSTMARLISKNIDLDTQSISAEIDALMAGGSRTKKAEEQQVSENTAPVVANNTPQDEVSAKSSDSTSADDQSESSTPSSEETLEISALDLARKIASKWGLSDLVQPTKNNSTSKGFNLAVPDEPFGEENDARFMWWKLLCVISFDPESLDEMCLKAFGTDISVTKVYADTQVFFLANIERRSDLKMLRKLEDIISDLLVLETSEVQ